MRNFYTLLFAFCCVLGVQSQAKADVPSICTANPNNLVQNCGFETGNFTSWAVTGLDVPGELDNLYGVEGTDPDTIAPHSGADQAFFADLVPRSTTIAQSIATLAGKMYTVSFYLAQDTAVVAPYPNDFKASFGGVTLIDAGIPVEGYTQYSYTLNATSSSSMLSLTFGNGVGEFLLDDVSVVATPEPSSWFLLFTIGVLCCFAVRQKLGASR